MTAPGLLSCACADGGDWVLVQDHSVAFRIVRSCLDILVIESLSLPEAPPVLLEYALCRTCGAYESAAGLKVETTTT